jgi:3-oxoacyl-[acyl-carrier protein] reductase
MDLQLSGRIALVTASTKGLGRACAQRLAMEGCHVAICSRTAQDVARAAGEIAEAAAAAGATGEVAGFTADMSKADDIERLLEQVRRKLGDPQIVVTNAGGPPPGTYADLSLEQYAQAFELSAMSAIRLTHGVTDAMKAARWGRVIMITSISVKQPIGNLLLSNMARAGLTGFMKTVATELAPHGVTVNAVLPGLHATDRMQHLAATRAKQDGTSVEQALAALGKSVPVGTLGDPTDFAAMVALLASPLARFVTGSNILIDGGAYAGLL